MAATAYDVHPGVAMVRKWTDELPARTGRTLDEWADLVRRCGRDGLKDRAAWLKERHGFGSNTAWWIAEYAADSATCGAAQIAFQKPDRSCFTSIEVLGA